MARIKFNIVAGEHVDMSSDFNQRFAEASSQMETAHAQKQASVVKKAFAYMKRPMQILKNCVFGNGQQ